MSDEEADKINNQDLKYKLRLYKLMSIKQDKLVFQSYGNKIIHLYSGHDQDCCESHYLSFEDLTSSDFENLLFDLENDNFFERVEGYGIRLLPINGLPIAIPGYGSNNGYYSDELKLVLESKRIFDIIECQKVEDN